MLRVVVQAAAGPAAELAVTVVAPAQGVAVVRAAVQGAAVDQAAVQGVAVAPGAAQGVTVDRPARPARPALAIPEMSIALRVHRRMMI